MNYKAFFIILLTLLAARIVVAQEGIVVMQNATTGHSVTEHVGHEYLWQVLTGVNPEIDANTSAYEFIGGATSADVQVRWLTDGTFLLKVSENDIEGCLNVKALAVTVEPNNNSIAFTSLQSQNCYSYSGNGFELPLTILDNNGLPLQENYFPLVVNFTVDNSPYTQNVRYSDQSVTIADDWLSLSPDQDNMVEVILSDATDSEGESISVNLTAGQHRHTVFEYPAIEFPVDKISVTQGTVYEHMVEVIAGRVTDSEYSWYVVSSSGNSSHKLPVKTNPASILWDGQAGVYTLKARLTDGNNCKSEVVRQTIYVTELVEEELSVDLGGDTIIGMCEDFVLSAFISGGTVLDYKWEPEEFLDDPTSANPVFAPGETTTFVLTVTDEEGRTATDNITVSVDDVFADAGNDIVMEENTTAMLDGTSSYGEDIIYNWSTLNGTIDSGFDTSTPVVSTAGTYYLEVEDKFGCVATDSVLVSYVTYAPIATDDYDTVLFQSTIDIEVLDNDMGQKSTIEESTLTIIQEPQFGSVYVDYDDYSLVYTPNSGYTGNDMFAYRVCNAYDQCDEAYVYVVVANEDFFVPQAFSPNGDNINDYFEIVGIGQFAGNSLTVINRWGKKVYEATNYGISTTPIYWDGKANVGGTSGDDLPSGTYFYVLDLGNGERPIAGSVYIDR